MSFSNLNVNITYDGDGADSSFGVNFYYLKGLPSQIQVELWDNSDPLLPTLQSFVKDVDYTIDESGYPNTLVNTTVAVPVNFKLILIRLTIPVQLTTFANGPFPSASVEDAIDLTMMVGQEYIDALSRSLISPLFGPTFSYQDILDDLAKSIDFEARITQNTADIATNLSSIGANASGISGNAVAIASNLGKININTADIVTINNQLSALVIPTIVNIGVATAHVAVAGEIVIIDTNDVVSVALPAPAAGLLIRVKVSEKIAGKTITNAAGIDGFGATFTITSEYESLTLVADATKWYII